jgi:hypothetical protein
MSKLTSIDSAMLENVTGGVTRPPVSTGISGRTGNDAAVLAAVQGIQSSLKDINKPAESNSNMFMMAGLAMAMSRRNNNTTVVGGYPGGYYYSSVG